MNTEIIVGYVEAEILWMISKMLMLIATGCIKTGIIIEQAEKIIKKVRNWITKIIKEVYKELIFWKMIIKFIIEKVIQVGIKTIINAIYFINEGMIFRAELIAENKDNVYDNDVLY